MLSTMKIGIVASLGIRYAYLRAFLHLLVSFLEVLYHTSWVNTASTPEKEGLLTLSNMKIYLYVS